MFFTPPRRSGGSPEHDVPASSYFFGESAAETRTATLTRPFGPPSPRGRGTSPSPSGRGWPEGPGEGCSHCLFDSHHKVIAGDCQRAALRLGECGFKRLIGSCGYDEGCGSTAGLEVLRSEIVLRAPRIRGQLEVGASPEILS